jgi:hypothetical protein
MLGQDVFLIAQLGPYAPETSVDILQVPIHACFIWTHVVLTRSKHGNAENEYVALHRDVSETKHKQVGRPERKETLCTSTVPPCVLSRQGILVIEGIEKAERVIMLVCFDPSLSFVHN